MSSTPSKDLGNDALRRLSIDKRQRPDSGGRPWLVLLLILLVVLGVGGGAGWWYLKTTGANILAAVSEKAVAVTFYDIPREQQLKANEGEIALVANGKIVSDVRVFVATKVSGQITSLHVEQGDFVEKDQILARLEDDVYRAQRDEADATVDRLRFAVEQAAADYERQLAAIDEARANLAWREFNHARLKRLDGSNHASDVELTQALHERDAAAAAFNVAKATAESRSKQSSVMTAELAAAEALLRLRQKRLDDCAIRAPISGVVLERNAQVGDFLAAEGGRGANANAQLVSIADMDLLRVEIDVSERDIHRIRSGQRARITPDAYKARTFPGRVMWIDPIGNYARAIVQVKVRIEQPTDELRIEGSAKVEFLNPPVESEAEPGKTALWVPLDAVKLGENGNAVVFTVLEDRAVANNVQIGARSSTLIEITSGAYPGMRIVADRADDLQDGTPIKPGT